MLHRFSCMILGVLLITTTIKGVNMNISKIVLPAAGFGTRFLPVTKTVPKGLLTLVNKPALQEVIEEGIASGIHDFCIIIGDDTSPIKDYFSHNKKLDEALEQNNKMPLIKGINDIIDSCTFNYIVQP